MSTLIYFISLPFSWLWDSLDRTTAVIGYSRAAAELSRLGYYEQAKQCMLEVSKIK